MNAKPNLDAGTTLDDAPLLEDVVVERVDGERAFRRRLLELGLLPGTSIRKTKIAPLGDPLELEVRGRRLSIRRAQARAIGVRTPLGNGGKPS
jgi:ferrous iron transport protein A